MASTEIDFLILFLSLSLKLSVCLRTCYVPPSRYFWFLVSLSYLILNQTLRISTKVIIMKLTNRMKKMPPTFRIGLNVSKPSS